MEQERTCLQNRGRQKRGIRVVGILGETSPQRNVPAAVPEEGLGRPGALSQGMGLELWYDVWGRVARCEPLLIMRIV